MKLGNPSRVRFLAGLIMAPIVLGWYLTKVAGAVIADTWWDAKKFFKVAWPNFKAARWFKRTERVK